MANYTVSGAGTAAANGTYLETSPGLIWSLGATAQIQFVSGTTYRILDVDTGDTLYSSVTGITGSYGTVTGTAPAPTVTAEAAPDSGAPICPAFF